LIVTALNLLPIGQLDGGHISHAPFGLRKARTISMVAMVSLFLLALFVWPGLMVWAFIVFFIAGMRDAPAANELTPVGFPRSGVGLFCFFPTIADHCARPAFALRGHQRSFCVSVNRDNL
jgi:membrane-associated protease RseP (regulator of RpoE activity)